MKKNCFVIIFTIISLSLAVPIVQAQELGATFCWHYNEIYGGHSYPYNQSIVKKGLPDNDTHWSATTEWWENMVEEIEYSGIDFVALLSRGNQPNAPDRGNGNPIHIPKLVNAMNARGVNSFKLAIFDDCPNSWTGSMNWDISRGTSYSTDNPKFDCGNADNYKYIWDYNLKQAIANIPEERRYKIDGRMVIIFWSVKSTWMTNMGNGNLKKILEHIRTQCQASYGFNPYLIINRNWFDVDNQCNNPGVADAVHNWFSSAGNTSYTSYLWNGITTGVVTPGFGHPADPPFIDPRGGQTLINGLEGTVKSGASLTLCEGFTDAAESAAYWRSEDAMYYKYPNQRLNILRQYSKNPYPDNLKMEVETCDYYADLTTGNSGGAFRDGDLDIVKTTDINGGWHVTGTQVGEYMEWKELPLFKKTEFLLRYKSSDAASVNISIDGAALPTKDLPSTNNIWTTIDAGNYTNTINGLHTVRLTIVSGTPDINYFTRNSSTDVSVLKSENNLGKSIRIYPNPLSTGKLFIDLTGFENSANVLIKIITLYGQTVYQKYLNNPTHIEINTLELLEKSVYIISIESGQTKIVKKLIVN
ncbi:MAG: DUF5010 domain-containing protein [Bacteroidia bacterium]|nr:DUF5010 domain-containing protein [Bacteroidia bacterium]